MIRRIIHQPLVQALDRFPVVLLQGARHAGKTTLAREIATQRRGAYLSLDDPSTLVRAQSAPGEVLASGAAGGLLVIDEVGRAPALLTAIAAELTRDPRPGRFLLTSSVDLSGARSPSAHELRDHLETFSLDPVTERERINIDPNAVNTLFGEGSVATTQALDPADLCTRILAGGLPEAAARPAGKRRAAWYQAQIAGLLQGDIRDRCDIAGLNALPRLLALLAARSGAVLNMSEIARAAGIAHSTLRRYLALLEAVYLFRPLPAWSPEDGRRMVSSPRIHLLDTGLTAYLRDVHRPAGLASPRSADFAPLFRAHVIQELRAQAAANADGTTAGHYLTASGQSVDLVLEAADGRIAAVEIHAGQSPDPDAFRRLRALAAVAGDRFVRGVVVYPGEQRLPISDRLCALPVTALWEGY